MRRFLLFALLLAAGHAHAAPSSLRIIAINDFHGHLEPDAKADPAGGALALAATLERLRAQAPRSVFVSAGDLIGASPLPSAIAHDEPTLALFQRLGLQANAIGNHELDPGLVELQRQQALAGFPFLSANLVDSASGKPVFAPYRIVEVDGLRVAFVGATVRNALQPLEPDSVPGLRLDDEAQALNAQAALLRARGVRVLVALLHEGAGAQDAVVPAQGCAGLAGPARAIAEKLAPDFDLVLSAHTHALYACQVGGRWLTQAGSYGRYLTVADLKIENGDVAAIEVHNEPVRMQGPADTAVAKLVDAAVAAAAKRGQQPVGWLEQGRVSAQADAHGGSPLGRMVAQAQALAAYNQGARFACTNPSSVPRELVASVDAGTITYADARAVQPYGNHLKVLTLTGARLRALLEQQWREGAAMVPLSCSDALHYQLDERHRLVPGSLQVEGKAVGDAGAVTMVANSYLARGGQGFDALAGIVPDADAGLDLDALVKWLAVNAAPRCRLVASAGEAGWESSCPGMSLVAFVTARVQAYLANHDIRFMYELTPAQVADGLQVFDEVLAAIEAGTDLGTGLPADARQAWRKPREVLIGSGPGGVTVAIGGGIAANRAADGSVELSLSTR